jgi:hypothetical protein
MTSTELFHLIILCVLFLGANWLQRSIGYHNCLNNIKNGYPDLYEELVKRSKELRDAE